MDSWLTEETLRADPIEQFHLWFETAVAANLPEPNTMTLATATPDGRPSARMVLLKSYDGRGFVFYTNYRSRKAEELERNPWAALVMFWPTLHRQIRVEGSVERVSAAESDAYFRSRARGSQIAAAASEQSRVLSSREELDRRVQELMDEYGEGDVPRPEYWGGYRVVPSAIEFWQGRPNRLHDRFRYQRLTGGSWRWDRLYP